MWLCGMFMHLNVFINVAIEKPEFSHNTPHYVSEKGCLCKQKTEGMD